MAQKIIKYDHRLIAIARELRKNATPAELKLWQFLKGKQLLGYDFHRQKPIDRFIVDFFCHDLMLVIEIDGSSHNNKYDIDLIRQKRLESLGMHFLRFPEIDVIKYTAEVVTAIKAWIEEHTPPSKIVGSEGPPISPGTPLQRG